MSFGKMSTQIQITQKQVTLDSEGFQTESDVVVATVRAYREGRHGEMGEPSRFFRSHRPVPLQNNPRSDSYNRYAAVMRWFCI